MALVSQKQMWYEVFELMQDGQVRTRRQISDAIKKKLNLTEDEIQVRTTSGAPVYKSRSDWSVSQLNLAGILEKPRRAYYKISALGASKYIEGIQTDELAHLVYMSKFNNKDEADISNASNANISVIKEVAEVSPIEIIESSFNELNNSLANQLLAEILSKSPEFFESLVVDLLVKMGYGAGKTTRYVADGGIDGEISVDALGLDKIYVQAKRYSLDNKVQRPEVQSFAGAMNKVSRGVFITTSSFSAGAREFADTYSNGTIILIDGKKLAQLMIKYGLGVSTEHVYEIKHIDSDYFE